MCLACQRMERGTVRVKQTQLAQGLLVGESDGWRTAAEGSDRPGSWSQDSAVKEDAARPGSITGIDSGELLLRGE